MPWTREQREALTRELDRIGDRAGGLWPTPADNVSPSQLLDLLRRVPTGAGQAGYLAALARSVSPQHDR